MKPTPDLFVFTRDGLRGRLDPPSQAIGSKPSRVSIRLDNGLKLSVSSELLVPRKDGNYDLPVRVEPEAEGLHSGQTEEGVVVLPVVEEELNVRKQEQHTGTVRIHKKVFEREEWIDEAGFEEEVEIQRVPVHRELDEPVSIRTEGDTLIVPLMEEVLVVEKRLILKEELHITKHRKEIRNPQQVTLRREEAEVERIDNEENNQRTKEK